MSPGRTTKDWRREAESNRRCGFCRPCQALKSIEIIHALDSLGEYHFPPQYSRILSPPEPETGDAVMWSVRTGHSNVEFFNSTNPLGPDYLAGKTQAHVTSTRKSLTVWERQISVQIDPRSVSPVTAAAARLA